ncbi:MAG: hypothetical protein U0325_25300 [Polyangiales bacterium]
MLSHRLIGAWPALRGGRLALAVATLLSGLTVGAAAGAQSLTELPPAAGDDGTQASGVSANGMAVGGLTYGASGSRAFRWAAARGTEALEAVPGSVSTFPWSLSGNGEFVSGSVYLESGVDRAALWSRGRVELLGTLPNALYGSSATAVSFSGNEVTGVSTTSEGMYHAFRWSRGRGMQDLGTLPGGFTSYGYGISGDGNVITGLSDTNEGTLAIRWTERDGMRALPPIAPGDWAMGYAANRDGSVLVGFSGSNAAVWRDGVVENLGTLPGGSFSAAFSVSGDGRVVGGICDNAQGAIVACVWTASLGLVEVEQLAASGSTSRAGPSTR